MTGLPSQNAMGADKQDSITAHKKDIFTPLKSDSFPAKLFEIIARIVKFSFVSYRDYWVASPAAALAALFSTFGAALLMVVVAPIAHQNLSTASAIIFNSIFAPLFAYAIYLACYYSGMFLSERKTLLGSDGTIDSLKLNEWKRVAKYDYLAHLPSDVYLISLAAVMQATLEYKSVHIFWAVVLSQFADDLITFLKEPAIWNGAKELVAWENRNETTLVRKLLGRFSRR